MNNAKKLIWSILGGMVTDNTAVRDALAKPDTARELLETVTLQKEELFGAKVPEVPLIATPQIWDNLPMIAHMLRAGGEELTLADFVTPRGNGRAPVRYAEQFGKLDKLFSPDIWQGRLQEMERVYFSVIKLERDKLNYVQLRRAVAAVTGELATEDRLDSYGLVPLTVRTNLYQGRVDEVRATLARHGDHIRKEYLFLLDSAGDNMFEHAVAFDNMDSWLPDLEAHGERLTKDDFLAKMVERQSILDYAVKHSKLGRIFRARLWTGHAGEMIELYNTLSEPERRKVDINTVLSEIKEAEYGARVSTASLADLTAVLNEHECGDKHFFPVHALGFERVWRDMAAIRAGLAARGERLTLDHLRQPAGYNGDSVMLLAARTGQFEQVMAIAADSGQRLTLDELIFVGPQGKSVLDALVACDQVTALLKPEYWVGRSQDLNALWEQVPAAQRTKIDFEAISGRVNMLTLRQRLAQGPRPGL